MNDDRLKFFNSLKTYDDIKKLISDGETESSFLECKSPSSPNFDKGLQSEVAEELSGFANSGGGIILFGVGTDNKRDHDVMTQIEPIGQIKELVSRIRLKLPLLTEPGTVTQFKILKQKASDTKGIAILFIAGTQGDPIRNKLNTKFHIRVGEATPEMPYELLKRMFLGSNSPDLKVNLSSELIKRNLDGKWDIPISIHNESTAPARSTSVLVGFDNYTSCEEITSNFRDISNLNPNTRKFSQDVMKLIYRGLDIIAGNFYIKMRENKKKITLTITIFAENMRAKYFIINIYLLKSGKFKIKTVKEGFLY